MQEVPRPGDVVWIRRRRWRIERATRDRDVVRLDVVAWGPCTPAVAWRGQRRTFLTPFDQVAAVASTRSKRVRIQEALARLAGTVARAPDYRLPLAMLDATADILPHQLEPALAFIAGHTRVLLADEVGLGKTIQAGLVVSELCRRQSAPRVLIVVPASLRAQWQSELGCRFGIECLRADRRELEARSADGVFGANPWRRAGVWLVSTDFVKQGHVLDMLPRDAWDLVVIDEAHGVCGDSDRYRACHDVAKRSRRVLLLTATPHSGDAGRFARLTGLGAFDHVAGSAGTPAPRLRPPLVFRRTRDQLAIERRRRVSWHAIRLNDAESRALGALLEFERAALRGAGQNLIEHTQLVLSVFRKRALSTFTALSLSIARRLRWLDGEEAQTETNADAGWTQASLAFDADNDDSQELTLLAGPIGLDPRHERTWLRRLRQLADDAARCESKVAHLKSLLERTAEPVVVFSEFRDSLDAVERRLRRNRAIAVMHGGQDEKTQRSELARYLGGPASVLLATDVAGQGLNLQSRGRWVISLELPWNPARLEQRLGRVDRLGQTRTPHLSLLVARHDAERGLLSHLARRVLGARRSFSNDALRDVLPPESQVRATLLSNEPARDSNSRTLGPSPEFARRWQRPARVIARELSRRRSLARRWRAGSGETARTIRARLRRRPPCLPKAASSSDDRPRSIVIGAVPILNGRDEVIDRRVVAIAVEARGLAARWAELPTDSRLLLEAALRRRTVKLSRVTHEAAQRLAEREAAILTFVLDGAKRREGQPGLFDASELRGFLAGAAEAARLHELSGRELEHLQAFTSIRLGGFEPEFVLDWPRRPASTGRK